MTRIGVSRRKALEAGACVLAGAAGLLAAGSAPAGGESNTATEEIVRKWYKAWVDKDEGQFEDLMTDNFTFTSAAGDDHISRSTFKTQCWDTQAKLIERSDLERVMACGNEAFVKYLCHTTNAVNHFETWNISGISDSKLGALECYFGAQSNFPVRGKRWAEVAPRSIEPWCKGRIRPESRSRQAKFNSVAQSARAASYWRSGSGPKAIILPDLTAAMRFICGPGAAIPGSPPHQSVSLPWNRNRLCTPIPSPISRLRYISRPQSQSGEAHLQGIALQSGWETFLLAAPIVGMVLVGVFRLDEIATNQGRRRSQAPRQRRKRPCAHERPRRNALERIARRPTLTPPALAHTSA